MQRGNYSSYQSLRNRKVGFIVVNCSPHPHGCQPYRASPLKGWNENERPSPFLFSLFIDIASHSPLPRLSLGCCCPVLSTWVIWDTKSSFVCCSLSLSMKKELLDLSWAILFSLAPNELESYLLLLCFSLAPLSKMCFWNQNPGNPFSKKRVICSCIISAARTEHFSSIRFNRHYIGRTGRIRNSLGEEKNVLDLGLVIGKISNSLFCPLVSSQKEFTIWIRSDQKGVVLALPQTRMDFWFAPKGVSRMMFPHQRQMVNKVTFPYLVRSEWSFEWVRSSKEKDRSVWYPLSPTHAWFAPQHSYFSSTFDCDENGTISKVIPFFL